MNRVSNESMTKENRPENAASKKNVPEPLSASEQYRVRREKLVDLRERKRAYPHDFHCSHFAEEIYEAYEPFETSEELRSKGTFQLAGRVVLLRSFGKAAFVKILDGQTQFQFYVARDKLADPEDFQDLKKLDLGDQVWAKGQLFRTKTGELSLDASSFSITSKCLHAPPEKFHGLSDVEERYRKRYVDLFSNERTREIFQMRSQIVQHIRNFFIEKSFIEVETPMMHPLVSGAAAKPFLTHHNTLDMPLYLRIAPELYLKRLVVGGMKRVFELNRNFRNEGMSVQHNPEFTMLEFYMAYATYHDLMDLTEELIQGLCEKLHGKQKITYQENEIDFSGKWKRVSMEDAVTEYSSFRGSLASEDEMIAFLKSKSVALTGHEKKGHLLTLIFEEEVEEKLIQPTFVTDYPVEVSPLARRAAEASKNNFEITERFEFFVNGKEIANGFNELNDPDDQKERFLSQLEEKESGNDETTDYDEDYIQALEYGLPPTAGQGIGIDRLTMLLTNSASIREVILFPQLRKS